jgi:ATP-dependent Clp protease adaptor protein ClpS
MHREIQDKENLPKDAVGCDNVHFGGILPGKRPAVAQGATDGGNQGEADDGNHGGSAVEVASKPATKTKTPAPYKVLLLNDDYTPMEFVVHVLQKFFQKEYAEATRIMLQVHHQGAGVAGTFTFEIAETKVHQVNQYARRNQHPLKCAMEKA